FVVADVGSRQQRSHRGLILLGIRIRNVGDIALMYASHDEVVVHHVQGLQNRRIIGAELLVAVTAQEGVDKRRIATIRARLQRLGQLHGPVNPISRLDRIVVVGHAITGAHSVAVIGVSHGWRNAGGLHDRIVYLFGIQAADIFARVVGDVAKLPV